MILVSFCMNICLKICHLPGFWFEWALFLPIGGVFSGINEINEEFIWKSYKILFSENKWNYITLAFLWQQKLLRKFLSLRILLSVQKFSSAQKMLKCTEGIMLHISDFTSLEIKLNCNHKMFSWIKQYFTLEVDKKL